MLPTNQNLSNADLSPIHSLADIPLFMVIGGATTGWKQLKLSSKWWNEALSNKFWRRYQYQEKH